MNLSMARKPGVQGRRDRGLDLVYRHCVSLDLDRPRARERLERAFGRRETRLLIEALAAHPGLGRGSGFGLAAC